MSNAVDPLFGDVPERIKLSKAPIVYVVAQVQFGAIMRIREDEYIVSFQDRIRKQYPFFDKVESVTVALPGAQPEAGHTDVQWHFTSADKHWRVVLASNAITLETQAYDGHTDFIERFGFVLSALDDTIQPTVTTRIGYRYVNRIHDGDDLQDISKLVQPNLIGLAGADISRNVIQSVARSECRTREGTLIVHWGLLQPGMSVSDMMARVETNSWILDVDALVQPETQNEFSVAKVRDTLDALSDRAYAFFRWAITEEFLNRFR